MEHSTEDIERAQKRVERLGKLMRIKLRQHLPYYGFIITKLTDFIFTNEVSTAATDGKDIFINPKFMVDKTDSNINFILLHELLHVVFMHRVRFENNKLRYNHEHWNEACDYVINYELVSHEKEFKDAGIDIEFLERCLLLRDFDGAPRNISQYTAEKLYEELFRDNADDDESSEYRDEGEMEEGSTLSNGSSDMSDDITVELPSSVNQDHTDIDEIEREVKNVLREVAQKGYDLTGTGMVREMSNILQTTKIRWDKYLRRFLSSKITEETSYNTPNRKYLPHDLILPGPGGTEEVITDVFIFIDTSGSIEQEILQDALNNAYTISHDYNATISLAFWNTAIGDVIRDIQPDDIKKEVSKMQVTTGGTNFSCVLDYIKDSKLKSAAFVVFTDGEFIIPKISAKIKRKMIIALQDTKSYDKDLESLGKIVSFNEKE